MRLGQRREGWQEVIKRAEGKIQTWKHQNWGGGYGQKHSREPKGNDCAVTHRRSNPTAMRLVRQVRKQEKERKKDNKTTGIIIKPNPAPQRRRERGVSPDNDVQESGIISWRSSYIHLIFFFHSQNCVVSFLTTFDRALPQMRSGAWWLRATWNPFGERGKMRGLAGGVGVAGGVHVKGVAF
jgi:hypothetical protein